MAACWVLNLDSDYELAAGPSYRPRRAVLLAMETHVKALAARWLEADDVLAIDGARAPGAKGFAWSPTPRAIAALERAGAVPARRPSVEVLRRVTSRAFAASLGQTLEGALFATTLDEALAALARPGTWRLKRAFGMAGREHRIVKGGAAPFGPSASFAGSRSDPVLGFVRASIAEGGVQIEPQLEVRRELAVHGRIDLEGVVTLGPLFEQRCDTRGAWLGSTEIDEPAIETRIRAEAERVGAALFAAGYFGPFGQDALVHRDGLQPRSEVNARFTMGYPRSLLPR